VIEFSVYSGYQCRQTRERYGVDWELLSPHLALGIAAYEDLFRQGRRCDSGLRVSGIKPDGWAAFSHRDKRLVLLLNSSDKKAVVRVEQPGVPAGWEARLHGKPQPLRIDRASFSLAIEPWGVRVITFAQP
jgi:hypothetical protein